MAAQRLTLAQATSDSRANQLITANAGAERDRMRLTQRTQEADEAQRALVAANAQGARQDQALMVSDARAQDLRRQQNRRVEVVLSAPPSPSLSSGAPPRGCSADTAGRALPQAPWLRKTRSHRQLVAPQQQTAGPARRCRPCQLLSGGTP